jgi:DNA-binding MurR/RpiR family transcriptional regulator
VEAVEDWLDSLLDARRLGPQASRVIEVLRVQPHLAAYASGQQLAGRANVNVATVVRTAQGLGFSGWPELRLELRNRYLAALSSATQVLTEHAADASDPTANAIRRDLDNLQALSRTVDVEAIRAMAALIYHADHTVVTGSGSFAAPGLQLAHIAATMGLNVTLERNSGTQLANLIAQLGEGGVLVVFNLWWTPVAIRDAARLAAERGTPVCVVSDRRTSRLTEVATHTVLVPSEGSSFFASLTATTSVVHAMLAEVARIGGTP